MHEENILVEEAPADFQPRSCQELRPSDSEPRTATVLIYFGGSPCNVEADMPPKMVKKSSSSTYKYDFLATARVEKQKSHKQRNVSRSSVTSG